MKNKSIIFLSLSNLSLISAFCVIRKYHIRDYKIVLSDQDGNDKESSKNTSFLLDKLKLDNNKIIYVNKKSNYNFLYFKRDKSALKTFLKNCDKYNFITCTNYGLLFYFIKSKLNLDKVSLMDEGITNWIDTKDSMIFIKSLILSILNLKYIKIPRNRIQGNKEIEYYYGFIKNINKTSSGIRIKYQSIKKQYQELIQKNKIFPLKDRSNNNLNVLLILAKNIHYKKGIDKMIEDTFNFLSENYPRFSKLIIKPHPGYYINLNNYLKKNKKKIIIIQNNLPIEFYDFKKFNLVISPVNSSLFLIKDFKLIDKNKIFFYDIYQKDLSKKIEIANYMKIKQIHISRDY